MGTPGELRLPADDESVEVGGQVAGDLDFDGVRGAWRRTGVVLGRGRLSRHRQLDHEPQPRCRWPGSTTDGILGYDTEGRRRLRPHVRQAGVRRGCMLQLQREHGTTDKRAVRVPVYGIDDAMQISSGLQHTCVTRGSGGIACWGINYDGQLGDGSTTGRHVPVMVEGLAPPAS